MTDPIILWTSPNGKWRINCNVRAHTWRTTSTDKLGNPIGYWYFPQYHSDLPAYVQRAITEIWDTQRNYQWTEYYEWSDTHRTRYAPTLAAAERSRKSSMHNGIPVGPIEAVNNA